MTHCEHLSTRRVRKPFANGTGFHVCYQCEDCGENANGVQWAKKLPVDERLPLFDERLRESVRAIAIREMSVQWDAIIANPATRMNYHDYIASPAWRKKRQKVMARDNWRCRAQMDGCLKDAADVHHLTYVRLGNEALFDLVSVCHSCHKNLHVIREEEAA